MMGRRKLLYKNEKLYVFIESDMLVVFKFRAVGEFEIPLGVFKNIVRMFTDGYLKALESEDE
jgi:hypothetical protein